MRIVAILVMVSLLVVSCAHIPERAYQEIHRDRPAGEELSPLKKFGWALAGTLTHPIFWLGVLVIVGLGTL